MHLLPVFVCRFIGVGLLLFYVIIYKQIQRKRIVQHGKHTKNNLI